MSSKYIPVTIVGAARSGPNQRTTKSKSDQSKRRVSRPMRPSKRLKQISGSGDYMIKDSNSRAKGYEHTPFGNVGEKIGGFFGDWGRKVGFAGGHLIGRLLGSGDYQCSGNPQYNCIANSTDVPQFATNGMANLVAHREYIGDIVTSATAGAFKNQNFIVNPGLPATFPWLSTIAENYEEYKLHGCVFEFKTTSSDQVYNTSANTALGTVILATEYNVLSPNFTNKQSMENYEYAVSAKPSVSQMHGIECALNQTPQVGGLFLRTGPITQGDARWYDMANFQIATSGFQGTSVNVGELWVTYAVEFLKPKLPLTVGGNISSAHAFIPQTSNSSPLAPVSGVVTQSGTLPVTLTATAVTWPCVPNEKYRLTIEWTGIFASVTAPALTLINCTAVNIYGIGGVPDLNANNFTPPSGTSSTTAIQDIVLLSSTSATMGLGLASGVYPTNAQVDIFVNKMDNTVTI